MSTTRTAGVTFRLAAPGIPYAVDVDLRGFGDRWVAAAAIDGRRELGLGATPRAALDAALRPLPALHRRALLGGLALLAPSVELMAAVRGGQR